MSKRLTAATDHLVALLRNLPSDTVRRVIPGAPTSGDGDAQASSLAFSLSALQLDALGDGGAVPVTVLNQRGQPLPDQTGPAYESSNTSVFTVNATTGEITAVGEGSAVLIARLGTVRPGLFTVTVKQVATLVDLDQTTAVLPLPSGGTDHRAALVTLDTTSAEIDLPGSGTDQRAAVVAISPNTATLQLNT